MFMYYNSTWSAFASRCLQGKLLQLIFEVLNKGAVPGARLQSFLISGEKGRDSWERGTQLPELFLKARRLMSLMLPALLPKTHLGLCCLWENIKTPLFLPHGPLQTAHPHGLLLLTGLPLSHICHTSSHCRDLASAVPFARKMVPSAPFQGKASSLFKYQPSPIFSSRLSHRSSFPFIYSHCHLSFVSLATSCLLVQLRD